MKHLLKLGGMTPEEILHILDVADEYKRLHKDGVDPKDLQGKAVALVFAKNSTRCPPTAARRSPPMCWKPTPTISRKPISLSSPPSISTRSEWI